MVKIGGFVSALGSWGYNFFKRTWLVRERIVSGVGSDGTNTGQNCGLW
jgi:hypothetical protein